MQELVFLKLGGSLITDKDQPRTPRRVVLTRLAEEIASAYTDQPERSIIIGHGSGSFGHAPAKKYGTRQGVTGQDGWAGFVEVWQAARALNQIVLEAMQSAGLPIIAFPPSALVTTRNGIPERWDLSPLRAALSAHLIPLINGDTVFDELLGGTILSTEDLFFYLTRQFHPHRILLAGIEEGVWADYPACQQLIPLITPKNFVSISARIKGSSSTDVTGGMLEKVKRMLELAEKEPHFMSFIFSGLPPGNVYHALCGATLGTQIRPD